MRRKIAATAVMMFLLFAAIISIPRTASAQIHIRVDKFSSEKFNIAVFPLFDVGRTKSPSVAKRIENRLNWCLDFTGLFRRINKEGFLEKPKPKGWKRENINFSDWMLLDALGLIKGWFKQSGKNVEFELILYDVFLQRALLSQRYSGKVEDVEKLVDEFANEMLKVLTGARGIFGTKIAFVRKVKGRRGWNKELFVVNLDGTGVRQLTRTGTPTLSPSWDKTGKRIVFTNFPPGHRNAAPYLLTFLTGGKVSIRPVKLFNYLANAPRFSPVDDRIAITLSRDGNEEIYIINTEGRLRRRITRNIAVDVSPSWSPDGNWLAFSSRRSGFNHIYKIRSSGVGRAIRLTYVGTDNGSPTWSPRGDLIAFSGQDRRKHGGKWNIFTMKPDGSELTRLTWASGDNEQPWFSPDGQYIVFSSNRRGRYELYIMRNDGTNQRPLSARGVPGQMPCWGPRTTTGGAE